MPSIQSSHPARDFLYYTPDFLNGSGEKPGCIVTTGSFNGVLMIAFVVPQKIGPGRSRTRKKWFDSDSA
ncbi:MAG: hypothetical protein WB759_02690, partial [Methanoregula sp.]